MHKRKIFFCLLPVVLLSACQPAAEQPSVKTESALPDGITLIKEHDYQPGKVSIPYKKYRLKNGLTVVLHEDDSDPLVHVDVTYHVGSAREEVGKSGFAHFFEHMMFQGSEHVEDEEHFRLVTEAGGTMNGTTNKDRTNYYETVPANQLEKMLWLEADRMGFLVNTVTQQKFEIQRETVKNERGQSYDNQPYGLRFERNSEALYPVGHPYSWQTIGYVEDLNRVNVNDLKAFFQRWYGPNNAVITIGGAIDEQQTLQWIKKYFAPIPAGPKVENAEKTLVKLPQTRYITLEDRIHLPLLQITYPTVYVRHADEAPLDVLSNILGGGKTSLFYKNLVKQGYAVNAWVSHPCSELACEFQLAALANPAKAANLSELEKIFNATLEEFEQRGVEQDDLDRTKAAIESSTIFGLQSVAGKVSTLASDQTFDDEPDKVQYDLDRYNSVSKEDVMRVYHQYIKGHNAVVMSIVPNGQPQLAAKEANFVFGERNLPDYQVMTEDDLKVTKVVDDFDRSQMPKAAANPIIPVPDFWQKKWANGMLVAGHKTSETPTISLTISLEGGPLLETPEQAGLAAMTAAMMNESTLHYSNEEMSNQLALLGSSISFSAGGRNTVISVTSLIKNLDKTLELLKEKLFSPAFAEEDFERLKQQSLQSLQQAVKNPEVLASRAVSEVLLGEQNRISLPDIGTIETVEGLSLDQLKAFYTRYYSPAKGMLVAVGDIDQATLLNKLDFIQQWQGEDYQIPDLGEFPVAEQSTIYLVDKPESAQSVIRIVKPGLTYDATGEYFRTNLMNFALGGMFNSRINLNLREDKGYTYGAWSKFSGGKYLGRFEAGSSVKIDHTGDALKEFFQEINLYQSNGMTDAELAMMKSAYTQSDALNYETPGQKAGFIYKLLTYDLDSSVVAKQQKIIDTISRNELNAVAAKYLKLNDMQIIVVGDKNKLMPQLKTLDRPIVEMDVAL
ncbi:M16 family metallopeptidase [Neptunicella sp. SCSIO 80796]|uniref:M16 family metallopeptidase n=1 Tax=Neptunicella plasticusilytica TaxID=3117012 RepID=UPI003A4D7989